MQPNQSMKPTARCKKAKRGVDLISDALPFDGLWYAGPNAVENAIGYAFHRSRSHAAVIRVYDAAGNVIETHEHGNPIEARSFGAVFLFPIFSPLRVGSTPFPLFPRIILPPVLSGAYWAPATRVTLFSLTHKIKITDTEESKGKMRSPHDERIFQFALVLDTQGGSPMDLRFARDYLRCRFTHLKLCAHLL